MTKSIFHLVANVEGPAHLTREFISAVGSVCARFGQEVRVGGANTPNVDYSRATGKRFTFSFDSPATREQFEQQLSGHAPMRKHGLKVDLQHQTAQA